MNPTIRSVAGAAAFSVLALAGGCVSAQQTGSGSGAPEPAKRIDPARFYTGTWLEIARRPMFITNGCVAGSTSYRRGEGGAVAVVDACRTGTRDGKERSIDGTGTILDTTTNAKLHVQYTAFISRDYWILDRAADYSWFIEASPDFNDLYIFTRTVPSKAQLARLVARARALGYDTGRLEFPAQPPG